MHKETTKGLQQVQDVQSLVFMKKEDGGQVIVTLKEVIGEPNAGNVQV